MYWVTSSVSLASSLELHLPLTCAFPSSSSRCLYLQSGLSISSCSSSFYDCSPPDCLSSRFWEGAREHVDALVMGPELPASMLPGASLQAPAVLWVAPQGCPDSPPLIALLGVQLKEPVSVLLGPSALLCRNLVRSVLHLSRLHGSGMQFLTEHAAVTQR